MGIIIDQLKALGFKVTDRGASRLIASRPVNEKILEDGLYCDSIMSLSYREYNEKFDLKDNYIRVVLYSLHDPLDNYFSFHAQAYGHMEKEVLSYFKEDNLDYFRVGGRQRVRLRRDFYSEVSFEIKKEVDRKINLLKRINLNIFKASAFDLVDHCHNYYSWQYSWDKAKKENIYSFPILDSIIKNEDKYYHIEGEYLKI